MKKLAVLHFTWIFYFVISNPFLFVTGGDNPNTLSFGWSFQTSTSQQFSYFSPNFLETSNIQQFVQKSPIFLQLPKFNNKRCLSPAFWENISHTRICDSELPEINWYFLKFIGGPGKIFENLITNGVFSCILRGHKPFQNLWFRT